MNKRTYNALRKVATGGESDEFVNSVIKSVHGLSADEIKNNPKILNSEHLIPLRELAKHAWSMPYLNKIMKGLKTRHEDSLKGNYGTAEELEDGKKLLTFINNSVRAPFALDKMKKGKTIGAGVVGVGGLAAGLALARDKSLLHKILYSGGLGLLGAGAGAALGDTVADYLA